MTLEELAQLGASLRKAQGDYFRSHSQNLLLVAKDWERRFDAAVKDVLHPPQPSLFGDKE